VENAMALIKLTNSEQFQTYIREMSNPNPGAKYKLAFVCDASYMCSKMSRVRFWAIECLGKHPDVSLTVTGPGFTNFNNSKSLQKNVTDMSIAFDLVIWYKPLNENYNFNAADAMPFKTCLRYNEMWDIEWNRSEIDKCGTNLNICHHYNDWEKYKNWCGIWLAKII
jgi:hypothetical protein